MERLELDRFLKIAGRVSLFLSCTVLLTHLNPTSAQSQPIRSAENEMNTRVNRDGNRFNITGGQRSRDGANLFHDFERFGLNANQVANFRSSPEIRNILGRISGGDISVINGLIQVTGGNSNLYLMNPAGIIFGPNARLNVPAAFTATTADGISFDNGWFSAVGDNNYAALVGDPNGFAFTMSNPGTIINAGNLAVTPGQQLTLLGGTVISTGTLSAPGGEITIATVPGESLVRISQEGYLLNLELPLAEGRNREDLLPNVLSFNPLSLPELLTGGSVRNATGAIVTSDGTVRLTGSGLRVRGGDVVAQAVTAETATLSADRNLTLAGSQLQTTGDLSLLAQDTVRVRDTTASPFNAQAGGDLYVQGDRRIDIAALNHPQFTFQSAGDLSLVSDGIISGDARFIVGGNFSVLNLAAEPGDFISFYIPIIISNGNVTFDDYAGASLFVEAGGSIVTGDITIDRNPSASNEPVILQASGDIQTELITSNGGEIFLNSRNGGINTSTLNSTARGDSGRITLQAENDIVTGGLNTSSIGGNGGNITLLSEAGDITTNAGTLDTSSINGNSGEVFLYATDGRLTVSNVNTASTNNSGGNVILYAGSDITTTNISTTGVTAGEIRITSTNSGIDASAGELSAISTNGNGNSITLHAHSGITTNNITSGGGSINLFNSSIGLVNTSAGIIDSSSNFGNGGDITLHVRGSIATGNVISGGGSISLLNSSFGPINTSLGTLDSTSGFGLGGNITLGALADITTGNIISGGGDIDLTTGSDVDSSGNTIDSSSSMGTSGEITITENVPTTFQEFPGGVPPALPPEPPSITSVSSPVTESPSISVPTVPIPTPIPTPTPTPSKRRDNSGDSGGDSGESPEFLEQRQEDDPQVATIDRQTSLLQDEDCLAEAQLQEAERPNLTQTNAVENYTQAIDCYQQDLALARYQHDQQREGDILHNLGVIHYALGNYAKAADYHEQHLVLARSLQDSARVGQALNDLGVVSVAIGDYTKAIEYYQEGLTLARSLRIPELEREILRDLGSVYYALKDYNKALEHQQQSLEIAQQLQDQHGERQALSNLGLVYYTLTDYTKAVALQQQSLEIARSLQDKLGEQRALENLGIAYYALEDYGQAAEYQRQSLRIAREIGDRHAEGRTLNNLGDALYRAGYFQEATEALLGAIEIWESLRENLGDNDLDRISIFETHETTYSTLQEVLVQQGQFNQALEITERGRAQAFVELLTDRSPFHSTEIEHLEDLNSERIPPSIQQLQRIAQEQNSTLVSYSIMKQVKDDSGVRQLEDSELYIWVIQPTGEVTFRQVDLKSLNQSLEELVAETRDAIRVRGRGENQSLALQPGDLVRREGEPDHWQPYEVVAVDLENETVTLSHPEFSLPGSVPLSGVYKVDSETPRYVEARFQKLHQLLIEPIADLLPNDPTDRVTFIPHGELFLVPFAVLQDQQGQYLIEKHTILTAPAIQVLEFTRQQRQQLSETTQEAVVIGNPAPMPRGLGALPYAEEEAEFVASFLNTEPLIREKATETILREKLTNARFIHLATHGTFDEENPLQGAIALAPSGIGEAHDGWFTAAEILEHRLNAELVVLSACNTGRGKITGDGVIGLSRSLIAAGTPSVVVSLWQVPDDATADLMQEFYRNWHQYSDKAQALRQAMLTMMRTYPNPHNWAAFTLVGEAE